jgi:hypothetical protein
VGVYCYDEIIMDDLIWIIAILCIGIAIGVPSWLIIQATERLSGRAIDRDSLYGSATLAAFIAMFLLPSREHTTQLQNFISLAEAFSGGAVVGSFLNLVYQWTLKGTKTEKKLGQWSSHWGTKLLENKIVSTILGGILAVVLVVAGIIVVGMRMDGVPLLSPLAVWLWDAIRSLI